MRERGDLSEQAFERSRSLGHEVRDVNYVGVAFAGAGLLALTVAAMLVVYATVLLLTGAPQPHRPPQEPRPTPTFLDEATANQRLLRERQQALAREVLASYGWVEEGEVARIPIDRAMTFLAERGNLSLRESAQPEDAPATPTDNAEALEANP